MGGGGKGGGGGAETTTYAYYATFAVGLCEGPIVGVRRIWVGSKLFYDAGSSDQSAIMASNAGVARTGNVPEPISEAKSFCPTV